MNKVRSNKLAIVFIGILFFIIYILVAGSVGLSQ